MRENLSDFCERRFCKYIAFFFFFFEGGLILTTFLAHFGQSRKKKKLALMEAIFCKNTLFNYNYIFSTFKKGKGKIKKIKKGYINKFEI